MIARGRSGDCCVACGTVGIDLPDDHGCRPDVVIKAVVNAVDDFYAYWDRRDQGSRPRQDLRGPRHGTPRGRLLGLLRAVAGAPAGERNSVLHWAACRVGEMAAVGEVVDTAAAADALTVAASNAGLNGVEVEKTIASGLRTSDVIA